MNPALFPGQVGQGNPLEVPGVIGRADLDGPLDLVGGEIAPAPDDVPVTPALEPPTGCLLFLRLPLPVVRLDALQRGDAVTLLAEPRDLLRVDIGVHGDPPLGLLVADDDDPELGTERRQVTSVATGDGNMEEGHDRLAERRNGRSISLSVVWLLGRSGSEASESPRVYPGRPPL